MHYKTLILNGLGNEHATKKANISASPLRTKVAPLYSFNVQAFPAETRRLLEIGYALPYQEIIVYTI